MCIHTIRNSLRHYTIYYFSSNLTGLLADLISGVVKIPDIPATVKVKIQGILDVKDFPNCVKHVFLAVMSEHNFELLKLALQMDAEFQLLDHVKEEEDKKKKTKGPIKRKTHLKVHALQSLSGLEEDIVGILLTKLTTKAICAKDFAKRIALTKVEVAAAEEAIRVYNLNMINKMHARSFLQVIMWLHDELVEEGGEAPFNRPKNWSQLEGLCPFADSRWLAAGRDVIVQHPLPKIKARDLNSKAKHQARLVICSKEKM